MTFASHLFAFGFGFICAIGAVLGVFYFILLKAIAKNEKNFANKNLNGYQDTTQTPTPKEERNSSTQSQSQNASTVTKIEPEKSQEHTQIIEKSSSLEGISDPAPTPELQRADSQEKRLQQTDAEKKPMDPIHMAVKSKKPNNASSSPAPSRMSYNQNDEVMISGWLKIRGYMNVWWNRWCIVKDGKFVEYRNEKKDDCFAIVLLAGCEISMRESSKKGFSFRISHPTLASIYSSKGLKGENLTSAKFPGNTSECIIRAQDEHEAKLWMSTVEKAIAFANQTFQHNLASADEEAEERIAPVGTALGTPTYGISPPMDDQDGSEDISTSSSPPMLSPSSPSQNSSTPIGIPKPDTPLSIRTSMDDAQSVITETESSREEYPKLPLNSESDKNLNLKSSIDIEKPTPPPEVTISTMHTDPLRDIMSGEESEELSATERSASQDFPQHLATNENRAVNTIVNTQVSISEPLESGPQVMVTAPQVTTSSSSSISSGVVSALPQKEGWMELKQGKMWKMYWFVLNNGMLTYFETEKSTDCSGLIDLDGCKAIQNDVNRIDVSHPTNKAIHFLVNSPESAEKPAASPTPSPNLEASFDGNNNNRTLVQLRTERYDINKKWLKSIEQEIIFIEGKSKAPLIFPKLPPYFESRTEKCHWFNVFIKRYFKDIRNSQVVMFLVKGILTRKFDRIKKPDYIGNISIDDIQMGNEAITIKEVVIGNTDNPDELVGEAEIQYDGGAGLTISTEFFINFPRWHFATVPVVASVKLTSMSGRVIFYAPSETNSSFSLSFTELPKCEFAVNLTVGDKHKYDVSRLYKVSDFVVSVLKKILWKNTVMPNRIFFSLPLPGRKLTVNTKTITSRRQQEQS